MSKQNIFPLERSLAVKGIAICAMLFHHCFFKPSIYEGFSVRMFPFSEDLITNVALFGKLCVGVFAFLSGYGLSIKWRTSRPEEKKRFFLSRYISTMSGYWFVFLACCSFYQFMDGRTVKTYCTGTVLENITGVLMSFLGVSRLLGTPMLIYEWWYMSAAILFILLVPVLYEAMDRMSALSVIVITALLPRMMGIAFLGGTHPLSFLMAAVLGVAFERNCLFDEIHRKLNIRRKTCKMLIVAFILFLTYKLYRRLPFEQYWEIKYAAVPILVIICLNETVLNVSWIQRVLMFLGRHSMNMYLVHMVFLTYYKLFIFENRHFMVSWGILLLLSLSTSLLLEWVKKNIHWKRLISIASQYVTVLLEKNNR